MIYSLVEKCNLVHVTNVEIWTFKILTVTVYCALKHECMWKSKFKKTTLKLLYFIDYFLSNHINLDINLLRDSFMHTHNKSVDIYILNFKVTVYCVL